MALNVNYLTNKSSKTKEEKEQTKKKTEEIIKKVNSGAYDFGVDDNYINSFFEDADKYISDTQSNVQNIGYNTAGSTYEGNSSSASNVRQKAQTIRAYLNTHSNIAKETKERLLAYIDSFERYSGNVVTNLYQTKNYYGKWETEEDYNDYVAQTEENQRLLNYDIEGAKAEKAALEAKNKENKAGTATIVAKGSQARITKTPTDIYDKDVEDKKATQAAINKLTQDIALATRMQNAEKLKNEAVKASDFKLYSDMGANVKNPTVKDAQGVVSTPWGSIGGDKINNIVTYSRDNWQEIAMSEAEGGVTYGKSLYRFMTEGEVSIYNYYLAKEGEEKANEYLDSIEESLNYRQANSLVEGGADIPAFEFILAASAGLEQAGSGIRGIGKMLTGDESYTPTSSTQFASGMVREDLEDVGVKLPDWAGGASIAQVAYDAVNTGANMLPSILVGSVAGAGVGAAMLGTGASGNAYTEMINLGYDKGQASSYAALVGASEAGLSYILGGISKLGGKLSGKAVEGFLKNVDNALARTAIQIGGNIVSEFTEEYLQEVLDPFFRNLALGEDNDIKLYTPEALYSGILGALTAGVMEGPSTIASNVSTYKTGKQLQESDIAVERLKKLGSTMSADSVAYRLAGKVDENTGAYTIGRLFNEVGAEITEANKADIQKSLERKGIDPKSAKTITEVLASVVDGAELTSKQQAMLDKNKDVAKTLVDVIINPNSTVNQRSRQYSEVYNLAKETAGVKETTATETEAPKVEQSAPKVSQETAGKEVASSETSSQTETKMATEGESQAVAEGGKRFTMGVSAAEIEKVAATFENATKETPKQVSAMFKKSGVSAEIFLKGVGEAYRLGTYGYPINSMNEVNTVANSLPSGVKMQAYYMGRNNAEAANIAKGKAQQAQVKRADISGEIIYEGDAQSKVENEHQMSTIELIDKVLKDPTGIKYHLYASYIQEGDLVYTNKKGETIEIKNGTRVYVNSDGEVVPAPNGIYNRADRSIWIDVNAGIGGRGIMLYTLAHELVHDMKVWSPEHFNTLLRITSEVFEKSGESFEAAVADKLRLYYGKKDPKTGRMVAKDHYTEKEIAIAQEEVVAETMSAIFKGEKTLAEFSAQVKKADLTLWEKIKAWFKDVIARINKAYKDVAPESDEAKLLLEQKKLFEKAQKVFAEGIVKAGENFKANSLENLNKVSEGDADIYQTEDGRVIAVTEKDNDSNIRYNIGEYRDGGREVLENWLEKNADKKTRAQILEAMDAAAALVEDLEKQIPIFKEWGEVGITYDASGKPVLRCKVKNGEYEINFDFSTVCKKRKGLDAVLNNLIKSGKIDLLDLSKSDIQFINDTLDKHGFEIACGLCFVDSKRYRVGEWASNAATMYNDLINSLVRPENLNKIGSFNFGKNEAREVIEGDISTWDDSLLDFSTLDNILATESNAEGMGYKKAFAKLIKEKPQYRKLITSSDIISSAGSNNMRNEAADLLAAVNAVGGTSKPKMSFSESVWGHEILIDNRITAEAAFAMGGARTQSFSDFVATMFFDYCQMFAEAQGKGLPMQAYTKEMAFAKLFGLTGARINLSVLNGVEISKEDRAWLDSKYKLDKKDGQYKLKISGKKDTARYNAIKENAGLDKNGNYVYEKQSINFDEAVNLQSTEGYSRYIGTIVVGISEKHIWKLLDDIRVRMVIPYHKSGISAVIAKARNIDCYSDFTKSQNTRLGKSWGRDAGKTMSSAKLSGKTKERLKAMKESGEAWDFYSVLHAYEKDWDTKTNSWIAGTNHEAMISYEMESNGRSTFKNDPMRQTCEDYLAWCEEHDMIPQFEQFIKHPNYYKMQEDFDVYDCITGEYVPQGAVEFKLPENAGEVLLAELEIQQENSDRLNKEMSGMVDEIINARGRQIPPEINVGRKKAKAEEDDGIRNSLRDSEGNELSKEQIEFFKDSRVRDKEGRLLTMYHGTANGGAFTIFEGDKLSNRTLTSQIGQGFYFTNVKEEAQAYMHNVDTWGRTSKGTNPYLHEVYLNITNPINIKDSIDLDAAKAVYMDGDYDWFFDSGLPHELNNRTVNGVKLSKADVQAMSKGEKVSLYVDYLNHIGGTKEILKNMPKAFEYNRQSGLLEAMKNNLGYDGIVDEFKPGKFQYVAFSSEQIKKVDNKNPTDDPDIRFCLRNDTPNEFNPEGKTLDEQLDDILKGAESFDGRYLYIGRFTGEFINMVKKYVDIKDLPIAMNYRDAYLSMESKEKGRYQGEGINYHDLGKEGMKSAIESFDNPEQVMLSKKEGKIELVLEGVDKKGNSLLSIVMLNTSTRNAKKFIEAHIVTSIYGRRSIEKYIGKAEEEGRLIYSKKEESTQGISQVQYEGNINVNSSFENKIPQSDDDVKLLQERLDTADRNRLTVLENQNQRLEKELADLEKAYEKAQDYAHAEGVLVGQIEQGAKMAKEMRQKQEAFNRKAEGYEKAIAAKKKQIADIRANRDELLAKAKAEKQEAVEKIRRDASERLDKKLAEAKAHERAKLTEVKDRSAEKQQAIRDKYRDSIKKATENRHRTAMRHKIKGVVSELNQMLNHQTKERHIPESMKAAVASALEILNLEDRTYYESRLRNLEERIKNATSAEESARLKIEYNKLLIRQDDMKQKLADLKEGYEKIKETDETAYDPVVAGRIEAVAEIIKDTNFRDMSMEQLEAVYGLYKMIRRVVGDVNKLFVAQKAETISQAGQSVIGEVEHVGGNHPLRIKGAGKIGSFMWNNLKPVYAFMKLGSKTFEKLFNNVRAGEDTWAKDVSEAKDFFKDKSKKYHYDKWDMKKKYTFSSRTGQKFTLTLPQIMSLYAYSKRKQADVHLEKGGFVFDSNIEVVEKKHGIPVKYEVNTAAAYNIDRGTLYSIAGKLTAEQKAFVDEMQEYLSSTMGEKGNEVSMAMYDIRLFNEKNYFPLKSAKQFMFEQNQTAGEVKLKNSGFSKNTVPSASNPIILSDFMDVWANHVNDMSMYHAFVLPLEDFNRVFNYKTAASEDFDSKSVKQSIQNAYGIEANKYISELLKDLNGGARSDNTTGLMNKLIGGFKKASVFASASVVIQQPSAIMRATAIIGDKYFLGLPKLTNHKATWEEVKKYAPVAVIKEMGYFDTNMGRSTVDYIKDEKTIGTRMDDFFSWAPSYADETTWCAIWNAVKRETKAKNPGLNSKSEEFLKKAGKRFTEVVVKTQVYDSVLSRSANMRSTDTGMKMATAFMAEPTTSINMLEDAFRQMKRGNKEHGVNQIAAVYSSVLLNAALVSLVYAARDDDDDENYLEKYLSSLTSEIIDGINPLTMIPFIKDAWSIAQGFDVERADMSLVTKLWEAFEKVATTVSKDTSDMDEEELAEHNKEVNEAVAGILDYVVAFFGVPLKNLHRDFDAALNLYETIMRGQKSSMGSIADKVYDAMKNAVPLWGRIDKESKGDKLYDALVKGDTVYLERIKSGYASESAYYSALRKALKDNDPRVEEAARAAAIDGNYAEANRIANEIIKEGNFDDTTIIWKVIGDRVTELKGGDEPTEYNPKNYSMFSMEDYVASASINDTADMAVIKENIISKHLADGKTKEEAEDKFIGDFKSSVKEEYVGGNITDSEAQRLLVKYGGQSEDEAFTYVRTWNFKNQNPNTSLSDAQIKNYYNPIKIKNTDTYIGSPYDYGISEETYTKYVELKAECKGTDKDGNGIADSNSVKKEVMAVINSLPLTKEQKDALYFDCGWVKGNLHEAPWR